MAQSDWNFQLYEPSRTFIGGTSGSAVQHVSMSNPLTSSGDWCRGFTVASNNQNTCVSMVPINNAQLSNSLGYEYGNAYSIRTWARVQDGSTGVCLVFKSDGDLSATSYGGTLGAGKGYLLRLMNTQLTLQCLTDQSNSITGTLDPSNPSYSTHGFGITITTAPLQYGRWHRLRMDVAPVTGAYDKITIYTGSSGIWESVYSVDLPRGRVKAYVPWSNNPNGDGASAAGYGCMGLKVFGFSTSIPVFIDGFEVYKERVIP